MNPKVIGIGHTTWFQEYVRVICDDDGKPWIQFVRKAGCQFIVL